MEALLKKQAFPSEKDEVIHMRVGDVLYVNLKRDLGEETIYYEVNGVGIPGR